MAWKSHLNRSPHRVPRPQDLATQGVVESCLAQIDRACREIAFCELAEMLANARVTALRGALSACRKEEGIAERDLASRTLAAELVSLEQTLPLEQAYRADQRDLAIARLTDAQKRLGGGRTQEVLTDAQHSRVRAALRISAAEVVAVSRDRAAMRVGLIW